MKGRWILAVMVIFMLLGTFPLSGAAKVDAGTKSVNVQTKATSGTSQLSDGGYPDVIEFHGTQNREQALLDIANGQYDLGMFSFPIETYLNLGSDISSNLSLYRSASSYNELTFNTYHDLDKDAPIVTNNTGVYFNPFAVREIRFALNYLISRDHIVQSIYHGSGAPMFGCIRPSHPADKYFEPVYNSLNLTGSGNVSYALALFDEGMSRAVQEVAKYNHTLQKINGTWYFDGEPVTVKFIIRVEDERREIGDYVAGLIEQYFGFRVERLYWDRRTASQVVFVKPPSNYEWNIYTGGWVASGISSVWVDGYTSLFYASWYGYVPGVVEPKHVNTVTVEDALKFIGGGDVNSGLAEIHTEFYKDGNDLGPILNFTEEELTYLLTRFEINKEDAQNTQHLNPDIVPENMTEYLGTSHWIPVGGNVSIPTTQFTVKVLDVDMFSNSALVEVISSSKTDEVILYENQPVDVFGDGELILELYSVFPGINIEEVKIKAFKSSSTVSIFDKGQYWDLQKISMLLGVLESARIFLIERWEFYPANKQRILNITAEPNTGINNRWSLMSAETPDGKLRVVLPSPPDRIFWSEFNPLNYRYDMYIMEVWDLISDPQSFVDFSGETKPLRCNWSVEKGNFTVPNDAVIYNQTQGWVAKNAGQQAPVRVRVTCNISSNWHNNIEISIDDIKNYIAFLYTWAYKDSSSDNYYSDNIKWRLASSLDSILGFQWTDDGYIVYGNYLYPLDDNVTGAFYAIYPQLPWEIYWAMGELVANADAYGLPANYSFDGVNGKILPDLLTKQTVGNLTEILQYVMDNGGFKNSFPGISVSDIRNRAAADLAFANTYSHLAISNGPYYIANYSPEARYLKLLKFNGTVPLNPLPSQTSLTFRTPIRAHPNGLTVLDVVLNTSQPLGALQFNVTFDPAVIQVVNFTRGSALPTDALVEKNINNSAGVVSIAIASQSPISSNGTIVRLVARVNAPKGTHITISIIPVDASDPTGTNKIQISPSSADINVVPAGDIDMDGRVTAVDALLYLRAAVGLSTEPFNVDPLIDDLTGDGRITVADALKALRIAVGLEKISG